MSQNALFSDGGLQVRSAGQAEAHLALLNVLLRATRARPVLAGLLGAESAVALGAGPKKSTKRRGDARACVRGDRIVDESEGSSGDGSDVQRAQRAQRAQKNENENLGQKGQEGQESQKSGANSRSSPEKRQKSQSRSRSRSPAALRVPARSAPRASFVSDYLVEFARVYGRGGHHSSRELRRTMADVRTERSALRSGVLEGQSVNYQELNRVRVSAMSAALAGRKAAAARAREEDAAALEAIMAGGQSLLTYKKAALYEIGAEKREKQAERQLLADFRADMTFSHARGVDADPEYCAAVFGARNANNSDSVGKVENLANQASLANPAGEGARGDALSKTQNGAESRGGRRVSAVSA